MAIVIDERSKRTRSRSSCAISGDVSDALMRLTGIMRAWCLSDTGILQFVGGYMTREKQWAFPKAGKIKIRNINLTYLEMMFWKSF